MKIFLTDDGTATIICPECKTKAIRNITRHKNAQEIRRIKISCHCGHTFLVLLEKRQYYRKQLEFQGRYICQQSDGTTKRGLLTVVDGSQSGLRIKLNSKSDLKTGDKIEIEFWLDKNKQEVVSKLGRIRWIKEQNAGIILDTTEHYDKFGKILLF